MKSTSAIRQHLADLKVCAAMPCDCSGEHVFTCHMGGKMMAAVIGTLQWILEEGPTEEADEMVAELHRRAEGHRRQRT